MHSISSPGARPSPSNSHLGTKLSFLPFRTLQIRRLLYLILCEFGDRPSHAELLQPRQGMDDSVLEALCLFGKRNFALKSCISENEKGMRSCFWSLQGWKYSKLSLWLTFTLLSSWCPDLDEAVMSWLASFPLEVFPNLSWAIWKTDSKTESSKGPKFSPFSVTGKLEKEIDKAA